VVDVEEGSLESIVRHAVADRFSHKTKIESLVTATYVGILKPYVDIAEVNTQIFPNHLHQAVKVAFGLLGSGFLGTLLHFLNELINDGVFLPKEYTLNELAVIPFTGF
jgi:hypothetical protein